MERELPLRRAGDADVPDWFGPQDHGWLRALLDELRRLEGRAARELPQGRDTPLRCPAPRAKRHFAWELLARSCSRAAPELASADLRLAVFASATASRGQRAREDVLAEVGARLGVSAAEVEAALLADLAGERRIVLPSPVPEPAELVTRANLGLVRAVLRGATRVSLELHGNARPVLRQVRLARLLTTARGDEHQVALEISGPIALFHHTTLYGRALGSLASVLGVAERFELRARTRGRPVLLRSGDPIPTASADARWDSKLEERFARDFLRVAPAWDLVREPAPLRAGEHLVFPDFEVVHRRDPSRRWLLEIVGFWTPDYLATKLERLRRAGTSRLIVCIDEERACDAGAMPEGAVVVPFTRRIDAARVRAIVEAG